MDRTKAGFVLKHTTKEELKLLSFVTRKSQSQLVEEGVARSVQALSPREHAALESARRVRS